MRVLPTYYKNFFHNEKITNLRLGIGGNANIQILILKNNAGEYDTMISDSTAKHIAFVANISGGISDLNTQKAKTSIVNNIITQFEQKVHRDFPVIMSKYYKDTTEYAEFFPFGLTEFNRITKEKFENLCARFLGTLTTYQGGLITAQMVTDITAMHTNFIAAQNLQTQKKADVKTDRIEGNLDRVPFENQLYKNFHTLAAKFSDNPEKVEEFFDMKLFFPVSKHGEEPYSVSVDPGKTADSGLTNIVGKTGHFFNNSEGKVEIYTVADLIHLDPLPGQNTLIMDSGEEADAILSDIGASNNPYLIIRNLSDSTVAIVVIELVEE